MGDKTKISWSDATWNPITGCTEVSPGCAHCYAKTFAERFRGIEGHHFKHGFDVQLRPEMLEKPLRWKKPRRIFVNSMSDLFHEDVPDEYIDRIFAVMALTPQHTFQILTKRIERALEYLSDCRIHRLGSNAISEAANSFKLWPDVSEKGFLWTGEWPLPNVILGPTVENRHFLETRGLQLRTIKALGWRTMVSFEPLLQDLGDLRRWLVGYDGHCSGCIDPRFEGTHQGETVEHPEAPCINWAIVGGESGAGRRPFELDWARSIRDQCRAADVPFFFKQDGGFRSETPSGDPGLDECREFPVLAVPR